MLQPDHSGSGGGAAAPAAVNASSLAWAPPAAWASAGADQWLLSYTRPGCANGFSLFCSLQRPSGRMLVNGLEASNLPANSHVSAGGEGGGGGRRSGRDRGGRGRGA